MATSIDNISINNDLWFRINSNMISFQFKGIQEDIHFSISYNSNSPDINFHVTRNTGNGDDKPRIEITRINKRELEELVPSLAVAMLNLILEPIALKPFGRGNRNSYYGILFHSLDENAPNQNSAIENRFINEFKSISKTKRTRLKIKGDIEACLKNIIGNAVDIEDSFQKNLTSLPKQFNEKIPCGIIISKKFTGLGIRINNRWYSFRMGIKPLDILSALMPYELAKFLTFKTLIAYTRIKTLESRSGSEKYSCSLRLFKQTNLIE